MCATYRPPNGKIKEFKTHMRLILERTARANKNIFFAGDYNLNCLDYNSNSKVRNFSDLFFRYGMVPLINKPTRISRTSATAIDNIFKNCIFTSL